jgi:hypothetical protein
MVPPLLRNARGLVFLVFVFALLFAMGGCEGGMRFELVNLERPGSDIGLPPPPDFQPCYQGQAKGLDTNGDGRPDVIKVTDASGRETCNGSDTDHDGKIDTWDVMDEKGQLKKRARDTNGDERADETWTFDPARPGCPAIYADKNGDGVPDSESHIDVCGSLAPTATTPLSPPGPGPTSRAPN